MKVIKESKYRGRLTEAPADGAVPFKLPQSMLNNPNSIDLKGLGARAKADADAKAAEEARAKAFAENKAKYADLIARAQAAGSSEDKLTVLFDELVPSSGKADTVAGELVRATMRLLYRDHNDGDVFYEGYGIEACGGSVAYLIYVIEYLYDTFERIANRQSTDDAYTRDLTNVTDKVLDYIFTNDSVWQPNEDDSRGEEFDKVYAEDYQSEWEPEYDYDFMIPPSVQAHIDAGNIIADEFIDTVRDALDSNGFIRYDRVEDSWSNYINITGLNRESYDEIEGWRLFDDSAWSDYIDGLNDEYGDPDDYEDDDGEGGDDFEESFQLRECPGLYSVGDKVKYKGRVTTIVKVENDPQYGVDYLIVNPDYDGTDSRYENIWVADNIDPVE